jgi:hypothetical protein
MTVRNCQRDKEKSGNAKTQRRLRVHEGHKGGFIFFSMPSVFNLFSDTPVIYFMVVANNGEAIRIPVRDCFTIVRNDKSA